MVVEPPPIAGQPAQTRRIALTYIDGIMSEIIEPDPGQTTIYDDVMPALPGDIALHHLGYLVEDHAATLRLLADRGYATPLHGRIDDFMAYIYADTRRQLGHFCEYICLEEQGHAFFGAIPRHSTQD